MSYGTVKANTIENSNGQTGNAIGPGFKNRIINGAMMIDQRNAGASSASSAYTLDRWFADASQSAKYTVQQNAGSVTPPAGFTNYLGVTSSSAYSVLTGDYFTVQQYIEGFNVADLGWGTANAKTVTLSFWVRSSLTGTFGGALKNSAENRSYPFTYTISAANTWEQKSITIVGDTTGTWLTNNGRGIALFFGLGVGSTYSGTAGAWAGSNFASATGATSVVGTNGATWYITGVQFEAGTVATSFDYRPYGTELMLCQRYLPAINAYLTSNNTYSGLGFYKNNTTAVMLAYSFVVPARIPPTGLVVGSGAAFTVINPATVNAYAVTSPAFSTAGFTWGIIDGTVSSGSANSSLYWLINGGTSGLSAYFTGCEL